jgi:hypothetical protein
MENNIITKQLLTILQKGFLFKLNIKNEIIFKKTTSIYKTEHFF